MSRLTRFKKTTIKFPKALPPRQALIDDESDSDDDFIRPMRKAENGKNVVPKAPDRSQGSSSSSVDSSVSEYFHSKETDGSDNHKNAKSSKQKSIQVKPDNSCETKIKPAPSRPPVQSKKGSSTLQRNIHQDINMEPEGKSICTGVEEVPMKTEPRSESDLSGGLGKTKCPFCNKELANKLMGTTHIKSCAKDLPTEQIIKAMELYERQIQEWNELGLPYPRLASTTNNSSKTTTKGRQGKGKGGTRKKKKDGGGADPELELALALSISLHEEVESRMQKENEVVLEGGQEKEVKLLSNGPEFNLNSLTGEKEKQTNEQPKVSVSSAGPVVRRRGKKIQLNTLPLFTASDLQKKAIIDGKVAQILDEEDKTDSQTETFYIREEGRVEQLGIPKRLVPFQNKECKLWSLAQGEDADRTTSRDSFCILDFSKRPIVEMNNVDVDNPVSVDSDDTEKMAECLELNGTLSTTKTQQSVTKTISKTECKTTVGKMEVMKKSISRQNEKRCDRDGQSITSSVTVKTTKRRSFTHPSPEVIDKLPLVLKDIAKLLLERINCDIALYGREEKQIKCHRTILVARCPRLLNDVIVEVKAKTKREVVPLTDFSHNCVQAFVWYLYTGRIFFHNNDELLTEMKDLGKTYGIHVEYNDNETNGQGTGAPSKEMASKATQTDNQSTTDTFTMTDHFEHSEDSNETEVVDNNLTADDIDTSSQELFPSTMEDSITTLSCPKVRPFEENIWTFNEEIDVHSSSSRDLFEDMDDGDVNESKCNNEGEFSPLYDINQDGVNKEEEESTLSDDGIDLNDILSSQATQCDLTSSERKRSRSRSVSPALNRFNVDRPSGLFTATQAAYMLKDSEYVGDYIAHGAEESFQNDFSIIQANKKQKIDTELIASNSCSETSKTLVLKSSDATASLNSCPNNATYFKLGESNQYKLNDNYCDIEQLNSINLSEDITVSKTKIVSEFEIRPLKPLNSEKERNLTPRTSKNRSLFRSGSTPNLTRCVNNVYRFDSISQNLDKTPGVDNDDPFLLDGNDTFFANLKMPDLQEKITPISCFDKPNLIASMQSTPVSGDSLASVTGVRRCAPKKLSIDPELGDDSNEGYSNQKPARTKARGKQKNSEKDIVPPKPKPKLTLPTRKSPRKTKNMTNANVNLTTSSTKPSSKSTEIAATRQLVGASNSSPMLNYSLIDTPILKSELQKYGLKPLPRSKAKVLLRHIYHETHK